MEEQAHTQFYREASILARLDHPNLPKVSDFFNQDGREYLVMDFVPGQDLRQLLEEARRRDTFLSEADRLGLGRSALRGADLPAHPGSAGASP